MFERSMGEMVRYLRAGNGDECVSRMVDEVRNELKGSMDVHVRSQALAKLLYLQMMGLDVSWAAFQCVEVMSAPSFSNKRMACLAASLLFHPNHELLLLTTNIFKKMLTSNNECEISTALSALSTIASKDVAAVILPDVKKLMFHSKGVIRKKAIALAYCLCRAYPEGTGFLFDKIHDKLGDVDPSVVAATLTVIGEMSREKSTLFVSLAPVVLDVLVTNTFNWVLMKALKVINIFMEVEHRLARKAVEPVVRLLKKSSAKSLQYECISTLVMAFKYCLKGDQSGTTTGLPSKLMEIVGTVVSYLKELISSNDQNLKCLGLMQLRELMMYYPAVVVSEQDAIAACLGDPDEAIRSHAVKLIVLMVNEDNLAKMTDFLLKNVKVAKTGAYRDLLLQSVIEICSFNKYCRISDFQWYVDIIIQLMSIKGTKLAGLIALQLHDVSLRVESVRHYIVGKLTGIVLWDLDQYFISHGTMGTICWILGEFSEVLALSDATSILHQILSEQSQETYPDATQNIIIQASVKIAVSYMLQAARANCNGEMGDESDGPQLVKDCVAQYQALLSPYHTHRSVEIRERSILFSALLTRVPMDDPPSIPPFLESMQTLFSTVLLPVHPSAQSKVPLPATVDLSLVMTPGFRSLKHFKHLGGKVKFAPLPSIDGDCIRSNMVPAPSPSSSLVVDSKGRRRSGKGQGKDKEMEKGGSSMKEKPNEVGGKENIVSSFLNASPSKKEAKASNGVVSENSKRVVVLDDALPEGLGQKVKRKSKRKSEGGL